MADLDHWWGQDLKLTSSGDLSVADGLDRDNQHIFRRLCTNGGQSGGHVAECFFHPEYGGSAPWYIGQPVDELTLEGVIRSQMYLEDAVSHDPEPSITVFQNPGGSFYSIIQYTNDNIGAVVPPLRIDISE